jgi:hypothetical protein
MGLQIVPHHTDDGRLGEMDVHQVPYSVGKVVRGEPGRDVDMTPTLQRFGAHEQIERPLPVIFNVMLG